MPSTAIFLRARAEIKKICFASLQATQKFGEHEQESTRLNFASKSSKGKILRAVKNFNGPFITPKFNQKAMQAFSFAKLHCFSIGVLS